MLFRYTRLREDFQEKYIFGDGTNDNVVAVDNTFIDSQFCAPIAHDIYKKARASEAKKRPSIDFMEMVQKDVIASMLAILIDWLVEVNYGCQERHMQGGSMYGSQGQMRLTTKLFQKPFFQCCVLHSSS